MSDKQYDKTSGKKFEKSNRADKRNLGIVKRIKDEENEQSWKKLSNSRDWDSLGEDDERD